MQVSLNKIKNLGVKTAAAAFSLLLTFSPLSSIFSFSSTAHASTNLTLADLPLGSVIQIMPKDTFMCVDNAGQPSNCSATTPNVLPLKFVKMQARDFNGNTIQGNDGFTPGGNYTYWMLMDNYCWWGSSNCQYLGARSSAYQSFNHDNSGAAGVAPTNFHNNLSQYLTNNIMTPMANFYMTLPDTIGGLAKNVAIPTYEWDMMPMSSAGQYNSANDPADPGAALPVPGWGSTQGTWTSGTFNPAGNTDAQFTFSGGNANPIMTSRIGLLSYTEWQGGLNGFGVYPNKPAGIPTNAFLAQVLSPGHAAGSGASWCLARWGTSNCAVSPTTSSAANPEHFVNAFNPDTSWSGKPNLSYVRDNGGTGYLQLQGPQNPRARHPWFRTVLSTSGADAWRVGSHRAARSVFTPYAWDGFGVSPVL
jgi:hypothetical protein